MPVDISGNRNHSPIIAICVNCCAHSDNPKSDFPQNLKMSNELYFSVWIIQSVIGLGVAKILNDLQLEMKNNVRIIFQFNHDREFKKADFMMQQDVLKQVAAFYGLNYLASIPDSCAGKCFTFWWKQN